MITIRSDQLDTFKASMHKSFEDRMVRHMQVRSTQTDTLPPDAFRSRTLTLIDFAEKHGIDSERDIRRFLELAFDRPPEVLETPQSQAILNQDGLTSSAKVAFLTDLLLPRGA